MNLTIQGQYFNGQTSIKQSLTLVCTASGQISFNERNEPSFHVSEVTISQRVANTSRYIDFPDGSQFETNDNDSIDLIINRFKPSRFYNLVHRLEAARKVVLVSLLIVAFGGWAFIQYGVPYLSREVAIALPDESSHYLGQGILEKFDENIFKPSRISADQQAELKIIFTKLSTELGRPEIKLEFRDSGVIGANAFALPNDVVVITDQLINIAANDNELVTIMLHEIGHIQHRHILRSMIQSFGMTFFIMAISGDVSTASSMIAAAPLLFIQSGYSQEMELEADNYSLEYLLANNIDPYHFIRIMEKLEASHSTEFYNCMNEQGADIEVCLSDAVERLKSSKGEHSTLGNYLSSHPSTEERVRRFQKK